MWSDHDFLAKNMGFFALVRDLLPKYAGFIEVGHGGRAKTARPKGISAGPGTPRPLPWRRLRRCRPAN
jgi:hypothetical protein